MDFEKISFRPSLEEQYYLERLNEHYNAPTIEFFRRFLADCRRWQIGNIDVERQPINGPNYPTNVNIIPRNEAQHYQYPQPDFEMQLTIAQQALQIRQMQEALMQMSFQLHSMRQQQYMYYPSFNAGGGGYPPTISQMSFLPNLAQQERQSEPFDALGMFSKSMEQAAKFRDAYRALWH